MSLQEVLHDSFALLREEPVVFVPKLVSSAVGAMFWLYLLQGLSDPTQVTIDQLRNMALFFLILIPFDTWIYNSYFVIVQQYTDDEVRMLEALRTGLGRLPKGLFAMLVPVILSTVMALPAFVMISAGLVYGNTLLLGTGLVLASIVVIGTSIVFYLAPAAVVLGSSTLDDFRKGIRHSIGARREVALLTLLSFGLLAVAFVAEGALGRLGEVGFVAGRLVSGVVTVYLLVVNPELFLSLEQESSG